VKQRPFHASLGGRIVALFLALLLVVQLAGFMLIRHGIDRNARSLLDTSLARGETVLREQLDQRGDLLAASAATLGADYGLLSTLQGKPDADTVRSTLEDKIGRLKSASVVAVLTPDLRLLAATGEHADGMAALAADAAHWPARQARIGLLAGVPHQMVKVPITQRGEAPSGWLLAGSALSRSLPDLAQLTQTQLSLVAAPAGENAPLANEAVRARSVALDTADAHSVRVVLSLSLDEAVRPYARLQWQLAAVTLLGVAFFAVGSVLMARRLTRPMQGLVEASRRLGAGDFDTPVPPPARDDELAELAQAFDGMRLGLAERTEHIRRLAYWDPLTRLPNRAQFEDRLHQTLAAGGAVATVLMLNLDRLEQVNQVLGRARGDRLLQCAAERLRAVVRARAAGLHRRPGGPADRRRVRGAAAGLRRRPRQRRGARGAAHF